MEREGAPESQALSLVRGIPLDEEPRQGALTFPGYLAEVCERYAEREAVVMRLPDRTERWSYRELEARSLEVARALVACGVGRGTRVGILMTNRPEYLSALFGTALAGGVAVVLSTFSTAAELEQLLQLSGVSVLVYEDRVLQKDFSALLAELEPQLLEPDRAELCSARFPFLRRLVSLEGVTAQVEPSLAPERCPGIEPWPRFLARAADVAPEVVRARAASVHASDDGALFFSSGTTSLPKGILHAQRAFAVQLWRWARIWGLDEPTRSWTGQGFFWAGALTIVVGTALSTGGAVVLQPLFDPEEALRLIEAERVSLILGYPHHWSRMRSARAWDEVDLSSLRQITEREIILEHPSVDTDWEQPNAFGTTETMSIICSFTHGDPENHPRDFGAPLPGNRLKVVDPRSGEILTRGQRGEICVQGPTLMKGYLGRSPEESFDEDGFYHTGDGGYVDERGHLFWEGRLSDIIKTGGANVSPKEVDEAIEACPGIKRTKTVGVPDDERGEVVVSCVVAMEGAALGEADVIAFLKQRLASFKVPRAVLFFREEEYPLTGNEKAKAGELRELACQRLGIELARGA